jgi:hypothetical protein
VSEDETYSAEQVAALEPPGAYANQVYLNVIDGMVRISFGLKAGGHLKYTEAVTVSPGLALALRELIGTYVKPPPGARKDRVERPAKELRSFRTPPH